MLALATWIASPAEAQDAAPPQTPGEPSAEQLAKIDAELRGTVGPGWLLNYRAAKQKATNENKDMILVFTGSDWIDICKTFDSDILNTETFFTPISETFVGVRFDFPENLEQPDSLKAQNQVLMSSYRVQGFPSVMLTDSEGRPYAVNGYQAVSALEYVAVISALRAVRVNRDEKFAAAESATGFDKAKLLAEGIPPLPGNLAAWFYRPQIETLIANDLQNQTGKAVHFQRLINDVDYSRTMAALERNVEWAKMIRLTDDYIRGNQLKGEELQHALLNKIGILRSQGKITDMAQTLLQIVTINPETATGIKAQGLLDQLRLNKLQQGIDIPADSAEEVKP